MKPLICGGCTECCKKDLIFLKPGDEAELYVTREYLNPVSKKSELALDHHPNGDCIYLDRKKGCLIHEYKPIVCNGLDCRTVLKVYKQNLKRGNKLQVSKKMLKAARRRS